MTVRSGSGTDSGTMSHNAELPLRILLFVSSYAPYFGGVEEHARNLGLNLVRAGHVVEVWTVDRDGRNRGALEYVDGISVRRFALPLPARRPLSVAEFVLRGPSAYLALRRATREFQPDLIHVSCYGPNGVYGTALSSLDSLPLVVSLHGETLADDQDIFGRSILLRASLRRSLRAAASVTGCSQFVLADAERRFGLPPGKGTVVFNGASELEGDPEPTAEVWDPPFDRYVLALGRIVQVKGFDLLLRAFASVVSEIPEVGLVIAGDGPMLGELRTLADSLGIAERVHFPGQLDRRTISAAMRGADVLAVTSRFEAFGIVILEGWQARTAVIATTRGGPPEFVNDGIDGILVDPFDSSALGRAIASLLTDGPARDRIARLGAERVPDFTWSRMSVQFEDLYRSVLAASRTGR
jgi:glycogen synthase